MTSTDSLYSFLEVIVQDNFTYNFPINEVRMELINLMMSQDEFIYFIQQSYKNLLNSHGKITADIFTTIVHKDFDVVNSDPTQLEYVDFVLILDSIICKLENLKITRIPPSSPDYDVLSVMAKQ
jgi:hypothetical protein